MEQNNYIRVYHTAREKGPDENTIIFYNYDKKELEKLKIQAGITYNNNNKNQENMYFGRIEIEERLFKDLLEIYTEENERCKRPYQGEERKEKECVQCKGKYKRLDIHIKICRGKEGNKEKWRKHWTTTCEKCGKEIAKAAKEAHSKVCGTEWKLRRKRQNRVYWKYDKSKDTYRNMVTQQALAAIGSRDRLKILIRIKEIMDEEIKKGKKDSEQLRLWAIKEVVNEFTEGVKGINRIVCYEAVKKFVLE
ncbi:hypothetical protein C1646_661752 [Rhizophagus diaphanus]|nr:hypothetical protein C1646_661752 [Rhizophagus diaphanus] [Rhizophagus sp. MUCL 43196]